MHAPPPPSRSAPQLRRRLSLTLLTLYGVGTTVGAGIYVLVGKVALAAGVLAPLSFLLACVLVAASAFSFAELSTRFPKSAGEAVYVSEAFGRRRLALLVGLMVILAGTVSSGTIVNGAAGYLREFVEVPAWALVVLVLVLLGAIAAWGIGESVGLAAALTVLEIVGLALVIWAGWRATPDIAAALAAEPLPAAPLAGVLLGTVLAFYAFIGFEDMVNVAEEVRDPQRTLPYAIVLTLGITLLLYVGVALVAVAAVPVAELGASEAPLALVWQRGTGGSVRVISAIAVFATLNGALIQIVMASRVLYGLAGEGWIPAGLGRVSARTHTPLRATALVTAVVLLFALALPLVTLAEITSLLTLAIFALVNGALIVLKRRAPRIPGLFRIPAWAPWTGCLISLAAFAYALALQLGRLS
jgi:amino acid transporter